MVNHNIQYISASRLSPYIKLCRGDQATAVCVYTSLQHRAALYFTVIQEIEIAFRNELSSKIEVWLKANQSNTTLYDFFTQQMLAYLSTEGQKQLQKAINDVQLHYANKRRKTPNKIINPDHNDIISHLTFGFWVYLLEQDQQKNQHFQFWDTIFIDVFQNRFGSNSNLFTRMKDVLRFRNNLYHQEAVWKKANIKTPTKALRNLEKKFNNFIGYLEMISPQRFAVVNESYNLTQRKHQMFDEQAFLSEINSLRNMLISPGITA